MTGEGDWRDGLIGLERNPEVVEECLAKAKYLLDVRSLPQRAFIASEEEVRKRAWQRPRTAVGALGVALLPRWVDAACQHTDAVLWHIGAGAQHNGQMLLQGGDDESDPEED